MPMHTRSPMTCYCLFGAISWDAPQEILGRRDTRSLHAQVSMLHHSCRSCRAAAQQISSRAPSCLRWARWSLGPTGSISDSVPLGIGTVASLLSGASQGPTSPAGNLWNTLCNNLCNNYVTIYGTILCHNPLFMASSKRNVFSYKDRTLWFYLQNAWHANSP